MTKTYTQLSHKRPTFTKLGLNGLPGYLTKTTLSPTLAPSGFSEWSRQAYNVISSLDGRLKVALADKKYVLLTLQSRYALQGENVRKKKLICRLRTNFWLLTSMFSHLLSLMLESLKMAKLPHCAETTHRSKATLCLKVLHMV